MARYLMTIGRNEFTADQPWKWVVLDATPGHDPYPVAWCGYRFMAKQLSDLYRYEDPHRTFCVAEATVTDLHKVPNWLLKQAE